MKRSNNNNNNQCICPVLYYKKKAKIGLVLMYKGLRFIDLYIADSLFLREETISREILRCLEDFAK